MKHSTRQSSLTTISYLLVGFLSLFIAFPIFIVFHKQIPDYEWPIHLDRILLFAAVIIFVLVLLSLFRPVINFIFAGALVLLLYGTFTDTYGFKNLATDYKAMFSAIRYDSKDDDKMILDDSKFYYKTDILAATNYRDPEVRAFAIRAANASFKKEQNLHER